jgi:hypothetical protein
MSKQIICGFTFVRNAVKYDYPIVESINSILPIVDEYVVAIGNSDDKTQQLIESINSPKIRIIHSIWDDSLREGGKVLAVETDKALDAIGPEADWCFYLQADEVVHEKYHAAILNACRTYKNKKEIDGLLFGYTHFYGSYNFVGDSRTWYQNEVRVIRNNKEIRSYKDAQGFRKNNRKLLVKPIDARIFHYGWVRDPRFQQAKQEGFRRLWHTDEFIEQHVATATAFDYNTIDSLTKFDGSHPAVMQNRLSRMNWEFNWDVRKKRFKFKDGLLYWIEKITGIRLFEYKNYNVI